MALTETAVNRINSTFGYKQLILFDYLILSLCNGINGFVINKSYCFFSSFCKIDKK